MAEALFSELAVDGFFLEYDDARSGTFEPLRFVPPGRMVVLGLATKRGTSRTPTGSSGASRRRRRSCHSSSCAFAAVRLLLDARGQCPTYDEQVAKLRLIVDVAADVWG